LNISIYSSGSIHAQKLFFANTEYGDLTSRFDGYYDTTSGAKKKVPSYEKISAAMGIDPVRILFLSDVPGELSAAVAAGLQAVLLVRPGNASAQWSGATAHSFAELEVTMPSGVPSPGTASPGAQASSLQP
jgi:enolase-phosphatase E1